MNCSRLLCLLLCLTLTVGLHAQRKKRDFKKFELGLFLGFANYQGDLAENQVEIGETRIAYGGFLRYTFNEKFGLKANIYNGEISGDDQNSDDVALRNRDWSFTANLTEMQLQVEWYPFGKRRFNNVGIFNPQVTPYVSTGVGVALAKANLVVPEKDAGLFPELDDTDTFINIPIGVGLRLDFSEYFLMSLEFAQRTVFNDHLDSVSENGRRDKRDWYMFGGVTFSFLFGPQVDYGF